MSQQNSQATQLLLAAFFTSTALVAVPAHADETLLDAVVVSATGAEQSFQDVQASVQVIGREQIEASGAQNATELLQGAVGVDAATSGSNSWIKMRGQGENATLILIDGLPRPGNFSATNLANFPMEDIEQIEIVRGPMSALYGADAVGGVINVITRRPGSAPGSTFRTIVGARTDDGERAGVSMSYSHEFGDDTLGHRITLSTQQKDSLRLKGAAEEELGKVNQTALTWAGSWRPSETDELRWRVEGIRQKDRRKGTANDVTEDLRRLAFEGTYTRNLGEGALSFTLFHTDSDGEAVRSTNGPEVHNHNMTRLQARYDLQAGAHRLSFAAGAQHDKVETSSTLRGRTSNTRVSENQFFVLAQDEWEITNDIRITAGVRVDEHQQFGSSVNPRLTIGTSGQGLTWRISAGTAHRAPSIAERYAFFGRGPVQIIGNPNLRAEEGTAFEAAIGWSDATRSVELVAHDSRMRDLIASRTVGLTSEYLNIDRARIRGLELSGQWQVNEAWRVAGSVDLLDAKNRNTGAKLDGRPRHSWSLSADYKQNDWTATASLTGFTGYYTAASRTAPALETSYAQVNLGLGYKLSEATRVSVNLNNVFDRALPDNFNRGYASENGRNIQIGLSHAF